MKTVWDIALNDLRMIFRQKDIWINILILPLVIAFFIGFANGAGVQPGTVPDAPDILLDVIDNDGSALSSQFLDALRAANVNFVLCPLDNDAADRCQLDGAPFDAALAEARLRNQVALALLDIPAGFGASLQSGQNVTLGYRSNENASAPSYILQAVQATVQQFSAALVAERVGRDALANTPGLGLDEAEQNALATDIRQRASDLLTAQPPVVNEVVSTAGGDAVTPSSGGFSQSIPGMATMYVMFAVFPVAVALMAERKQGTLQRMVTMPIARWQILGGKLLARFIMGMLQYGIVFFGGLLLFPLIFNAFFGMNTQISFGNDLPALLLTMVVYTLCVTALTLLLTTFLKNEAQAGALTLLLTLTLAPLGGAWWPLEIVPDWMRTLGHISPVAWAMNSYSELIFFNGSLLTVLPFIGVLAAAAAVFFAIGVARFRYE
ncbi:MAG: ABC transporter permease [Chloroflexota bacterium]|nr:ABC transporter permease [Chloroflexota bacterium]